MDSRKNFSELIRRHGDKAYNFAYRLAGNEQDARDLVQEALARAFQSRDRYDPARPFDSWLLKIMQNIYLDGVRRYAHRNTVSLDVPGLSGERAWEKALGGADGDPADSALRIEEDKVLQQALESLPVHYRGAVALSDIEGLSYEQISRVMACPVGTVRSRIHQGRILLRRAYEALQSRGGNHEPA